MNKTYSYSLLKVFLFVFMVYLYDESRRDDSFMFF